MLARPQSRVQGPLLQCEKSTRLCPSKGTGNYRLRAMPCGIALIVSVPPRPA